MNFIYFKLKIINNIYSAPFDKTLYKALKHFMGRFRLLIVLPTKNEAETTAYRG